MVILKSINDVAGRNVTFCNFSFLRRSQVISPGTFCFKECAFIWALLFKLFAQDSCVPFVFHCNPYTTHRRTCQLRSCGTISVTILLPLAAAALVTHTSTIGSVPPADTLDALVGLPLSSTTTKPLLLSLLHSAPSRTPPSSFAPPPADPSEKLLPRNTSHTSPILSSHSLMGFVVQDTLDLCAPTNTLELTMSSNLKTRSNLDLQNPSYIQSDMIS